MKLWNRLRMMLGLGNPVVDDSEERANWWREIYMEETALRDLSHKQRIESSDMACRAWRKSGRFRRILKMCAAQVVGNKLSIKVNGDRRVKDFIYQFVNYWENGVQGSMVNGVQGFMARIIQMYHAALRDGDLYVVLFVDPVSGMVTIRNRPRRVIAYTRTDDEDCERELWYAEIQEPMPEGEEKKNISSWEKVWLAPSELTIKSPEMLHFSLDSIDDSTQGESLADTVLPWVEKYEDMLDARAQMIESLGRIQWMIGMKGVDFQTRAERRRVLEKHGWGKGGFVITDPLVEEWTPVEARSWGGEVAMDLEAVRNEAYISGGIVPLWSGDGEVARAASRSITPVALSTLRVDQRLFFAFLEAILTRAVEKWAYIRGYQLRSWNISVVSADTTNYEILEAARAFSAGVEGVTKAVEYGLLSQEEAQALVKRYAGMAEEIETIEGAQSITLSLVKDEI